MTHVQVIFQHRVMLLGGIALLCYLFCSRKNFPFFNSTCNLIIIFGQDRHLTEAALKASALRRQQASNTPSKQSSEKTNTNNTSSSSSASYPQDAALQAIRRFAPRPPYPELGVRIQFYSICGNDACFSPMYLLDTLIC